MGPPARLDSGRAGVFDAKFLAEQGDFLPEPVSLGSEAHS